MNMKIKRLVASFLSAIAILPAVAATNTDTTTVTHAPWSRDAIIYEVNLRQYTPEGTIAAFRPHMERLREMGVNILWFMPVHPISEANRKGTLGSYYAVKDYKAVNPEFGTLEEFKDMVKQAHAMGMKVIIDWVPNHTGCDNEWVTTHPEYYATNKEGKMYGPYDWTDVYKLNYNNDGTRRAMTDALKFWLSEVDIDGFRCDVAAEVPTRYWDEARPELEQVKKPIFMLAEASVPELEKNAFDMAYNWPMKDLFSAIAAHQGQYTFIAEGETAPKIFPEKHADDIFVLLEQQAAEYPVDSYMMNMITNHDLNSWEGTEFHRLGNFVYAFAVLSYTLPGMPLIYTGQEVGLDRALQFFEKDKAPEWKDSPFTDFYNRMGHIKHENRVLDAGAAGAPVVKVETGSRDVIAFDRTSADGKEGLRVYANLGKKPYQLPENMRDIITHQDYTTIEPGHAIIVKK